MKIWSDTYSLFRFWRSLKASGSKLRILLSSKRLYKKKVVSHIRDLLRTFSLWCIFTATLIPQITQWDSSQGKHESSPRQKLLSTIKKVVIEILQMLENDNQSTRVFGVRTVQNLRNIRKCEALAYNISSDVRPCRESLVRRSISFLFKYLYNRPMAKEGKYKWTKGCWDFCWCIIKRWRMPLTGLSGWSKCSMCHPGVLGFYYPAII